MLNKGVRFNGTVFVALLLLMGACSSDKETIKENTEGKEKPNVILIMTDDQGYGDLGIHGNKIIKTPNLDAFGDTALRLTNFHVGTTCTPTRAGLMTGRNANRNNGWHTISGCSILTEDEYTIAQAFEANGYQTAMFGKWHLGDNYPFKPEHRGFQHAFYSMGGGVNQTPDYWNNNYFDDTYFRNGKPEKTIGYCTDVWFGEAKKYIQDVKEKPFFLYLTPNAAHSPFNVPVAYYDLYKDADLTEKQKRFYGMITNIDDNFGDLVTYLKAEDLFDNTILIFTTDNGTAMGYSKEDGVIKGYDGGLRGRKGSHYEGGHRVPMMVSWPHGDLLQGTSIGALTAHVDLMPTLVEITGGSLPESLNLDGRNMYEVLKGKDKGEGRTLIIDTQRNQWPEKYRNPCVMKDDWRLVNGNELYDLAADLHQTTNIADQHPEVVKELQVAYEDWWASIVPDFKHASIPIGTKNASDVMVTIHDLHTASLLPWNQEQIRSGKFNPSGYYDVTIKEAGIYKFQLYRYPPESNLALNASSERIQGRKHQISLEKGKVFQPVKLAVKVGDVVMHQDVNADNQYAEVKGELKAGKQEMLSYFLSAKGDTIPAYYTRVIQSD